jgi:hypothetical protein
MFLYVNMRVLLIVMLISFSVGIAKPQWKLRIPPSTFSFKGLHFSTSSHDRDKHIVYALARGYVFSIDIKTFTIDSIKLQGIPAIGEQHVLDVKNNRLLYGKGGMLTKYAIDLATGTCSIFIPNQDDERSHFSSLYWNDKTERLGYFGGYGYHEVNNWIFEYENKQWIKVYENIDNCNPPKRAFTRFILGHPQKPHLFLVSGLVGNCSGDQREQYCQGGLSAVGNDIGNWCWMRDVFLYDYEKHTFTNIIGPHEESMTHEGVGAYDFDNHVMYIVGGYIPRVRERTFHSYMSHNSLLRLRIGKDKNFKTVETNTNGMNLYSWHDQHHYGAYYNPANKSLVWLRNDGLWELELR